MPIIHQFSLFFSAKSRKINVLGHNLRHMYDKQYSTKLIQFISAQTQLN